MVVGKVDCFVGYGCNVRFFVPYLAVRGTLACSGNVYSFVRFCFRGNVRSFVWYGGGFVASCGSWWLPM